MKTILVVDDSAICREPIAATLRLNGYLTLEAENGKEALQLAHARQPDLILLDVTMPIMDGLACVKELRRSAPTRKIPVIMLTASSERKIVIQAALMGISKFLLKTNFSTTELFSHVHSLIGAAESGPNKQPDELEMKHERPTSSNSTIGKPHAVGPKPTLLTPIHRHTKAEVLHRLTQEIELQSINPVLEYVIALTRSRTSTIEDVASAIRQDQALTLRVLRVANSSFYQRERSRKNVMEATQLIGLTAVRNTVIAILAIEHFEHAMESGIVPQRFWEHSLATGVLAEMIGEAVASRTVDHLFLAGLLHDLGRMVLSTIYPKEYAAVLAKAKERDRDLASIELEAFGLSHVYVTRELLARWKMAPAIIEAASLHEASIDKIRGCEHDRQGALIVALANRLAHALALGDSGNAQLLPYHDFASELNLDNGAIERIATAALQKTTDTEMFYAAQSGQHFCRPMAVELANRAKVSPRIAVLCTDAPGDPYSLFLKQLGWLEQEKPTIAMIFAQSAVDFIRYLPMLRKLDSVGRRLVPVIVATADAGIGVPTEWSCGRQVETISLPSAFSRIVDTVIRCSLRVMTA